MHSILNFYALELSSSEFSSLEISSSESSVSESEGINVVNNILRYPFFFSNIFTFF